MEESIRKFNDIKSVLVVRDARGAVCCVLCAAGDCPDDHQHKERDSRLPVCNSLSLSPVAVDCVALYSQKVRLRCSTGKGDWRGNYYTNRKAIVTIERDLDCHESTSEKDRLLAAYRSGLGLQMVVVWCGVMVMVD